MKEFFVEYDSMLEDLLFVFHMADKRHLISDEILRVADKVIRGKTQSERRDLVDKLLPGFPEGLNAVESNLIIHAARGPVRREVKETLLAMNRARDDAERDRIARARKLPKWDKMTLHEQTLAIVSSEGWQWIQAARRGDNDEA